MADKIIYSGSIDAGDSGKLHALNREFESFMSNNCPYRLRITVVAEIPDFADAWRWLVRDAKSSTGYKVSEYFREGREKLVYAPCDLITRIEESKRTFFDIRSPA